MSTIIQIKRNSGTTAPGTSDLVVGEMAYAYDASNNGASAKLYIEAVNASSAADIHIIGGKYFTDMLDHTAGTLTASSAIIVDGSSKIDVLNVDNVTINGNDISSSNSNGNLTLTPNGTGIVDVNKTDGFKLPVGTTAQRSGSAVAGQIRYNSTLSTFEGYGSAWGSLGGVIDVDQDTKITAEASAGSDEDYLNFYTGVSGSAVSQMILDDGVLYPTTDNDIDLGKSDKEFKNAFFDGTVTSDAFAGPLTGDVTGDVTGNVSGTAATVTGAAQSNITSLGTLTILNVDNVRVDGNTISSTDSNGNINIAPNGTGDVVATTDLFCIYGTEGEATTLKLATDESDDNGDDWTIVNSTGNTLTFNSDISGSAVAQITLTPHATVASSTTAIAGALTVAGATTFAGTIDMGNGATTNVNIDGGAIDAVTIGTNSAVTDLRVDNLKLDGNTVSSTNSNGDVNLTPNGTGNVVAYSDSVIVSATEGEAASFTLQTDEGDDNGDVWKLSNSTSNVLSFGNNASGSNVSHFQITPNSTVASSTAAFAGHVTVAGNLTVSGSTTTVSSTNTTMADVLIELATGSSGSASGDRGLVLERGSDDNVFIGWDESIDALVVGTGSFTGSSTGDLSHTLAAAKFGSLTLSTDLAVADGGTGASSFTDNGIMYGNGGSALSVTAAPGSSPETASYQILTANSSGVPKWTTTIDGGTY